MHTDKFDLFTRILNEELLPAMGCTEPIAIAYASAKAREVLGDPPNKVLIQVSGSIVKNVKSVIVPNTNHLKGIEAAATAGIIAGKSDKKLEVIADVTKEDTDKMRVFLNDIPIKVEHVDNGVLFDIIVTLFNEKSYAKVRICNFHTNIVLVEKDNEVILEKEIVQGVSRTDRSILSMESIWEYINNVDLETLKTVLHKQIEYNYAIALEGLKNEYGACIGNIIINSSENTVKNRAKAMAAAGSDARMNGCELPVVINSGSGNQGITCSVPVIEYAKDLNVNEDKLYRALALSNLTAIHQKTGIGTLSAYCGVVSASVGAGAGIAYLNNFSFEEISKTITNSLAIVSGMVCDGAKASCAAKIASSVDAALLGIDMCKKGTQFEAGDGLVGDGVEETISNIGKLSKDGMAKTNIEIINIMVGN